MNKLNKTELTKIEIVIQKQMKDFTEIISKTLSESCAKGRCDVKNSKVYYI